jgi:hypothetical protein
VDAGDKRAADVAILVRVSHRWRMGHLPPGTARPRLPVLFFRHHFWERLIASVGIVLVFAAFYLRFRHALGV